MKRERKEKRQGQQEYSLLEKQLLQLRRMKTIRKGKRQGQQGEPEGLLEKQLLQSLRIDHRGKRKQPLGPKKLRL
jgi:hypothetical protein